MCVTHVHVPLEAAFSSWIVIVVFFNVPIVRPFIHLSFLVLFIFPLLIWTNLVTCTHVIKVRFEKSRFFEKFYLNLIVYWSTSTNTSIDKCWLLRLLRLADYLENQIFAWTCWPVRDLVQEPAPAWFSVDLKTPYDMSTILDLGRQKSIWNVPKPKFFYVSAYGFLPAFSTWIGCYLRYNSYCGKL